MKLREGIHYYFYVFLIISLQRFSCCSGSIPSCPSQCQCPNTRSKPQPFPADQDLLKLKCGGGESKVSLISELQIPRTFLNASQLDLSDNNIAVISKNIFTNFTYLQKLDLSKNVINFIEKGAFSNLNNLKRLDLSRNRLEVVHAVFSGLLNLDRLKLNQNRISIIKEGTFKDLTSLKQLDLSENPWNCNCGILWLLKWVQVMSIKLMPPPKCATPNNFLDQPLKKFQRNSEVRCKDLASTLGLLELVPSMSQVVFEGDSLSLHCQAPVLRQTILTWNWQDEAARLIFSDLNVTDTFSSESSTSQSWLHINHLLSNHSGQWQCHLTSESGNQSQAITVTVISKNTKYCSQTVTSDSKGVYLWPKTVLGFTAELLCEGESSGGRHAYRLCNRQGDWSTLNATSCPFVSETTKILEQFAKMNLSLSKGTMMESAKRLKNFTGNGKQLKDKMDVIFITKTIENYLNFISREQELGPLLIDVVGSILQVSRDILFLAELEDHACSRLVEAVEYVAENTPSQSLQAHKTSIAVEPFYMKPDTFPGLTCTWYSQDGGRLFHCSNSNPSTLHESKAKVFEALIQVPPSLFSQLEHQGISTVSTRQLIITMYENNRLFPKMNSSDVLDVTSAIIGVKLVGIDPVNLTEPVLVILRAPSLHHAAGSPRPVWWDVKMNNVTGGWSTNGCQLSHFLDELIFFHCNRLGYFGLLQKTDFLYDESGRLLGMKFRFSHPSIYIGSFVAVVTLAAAIISFIVCNASINMSKKTKHSLANTWVALALLCLVYALGINQTEDVKVCQGIGLVLHYLTLSVLLWMAVTVSNMYKRLTKCTSLHPPDDELPSDQPAAQKPILGLYLVGWGIGLIVCGISGAVNIREYAGHSHCFLTSGPSLSAVLVPAAMITMYLLIFYLLNRCTIRNMDTNGQLSEGTQATENVDIELLDSGVNNLATERVSLHSTLTPTASSEVEDSEYSPGTQLKAHVIIFVLFLLMWTAAAIATATPFKDSFPHEEAIFSCIYAILASCLGGFIVFFYCIARSDVRGEWYSMRCWCRRKQGRCCRTRSISDTNPDLPIMQPLPANIVVIAGPNVVASRLSVDNSLSHHTNKTASTNKSINAIRAVNELNSKGVRSKTDLTFEGKSNVNLVVLHRQQYRSNNSVTTYTEASGTSGAEMFYNPHQSTTARKFFRKQRRHLKQNNLGTRRSGDGGGRLHDNVSTRPRSPTELIPGVYNQGSKVNNTNIHIEASVKESRSLNPNILVENSEDELTKDIQLERLVIGEEKDDVSVEYSADNDLASRNGDMNIEFEESEAELASLAAEFQAIKEEIKQNQLQGTFNNKLTSSPSPIYSEDNFMSRTNSGGLGTSCSIENCDTAERQSLAEINSEITIPETCSFISNSDSRFSSQDIDSDDIDRYHNESLLSLNEMEGEMIDIGISSPELQHVRFKRNKIQDCAQDTKYCNNSPVSGDVMCLETKELQCILNDTIQSNGHTERNNPSLEDIYVDNGEGNDAHKKKETSV